ncbi:MAG: hypothetical protein NTW15_15840 [Burkholderiales bacterium]|nr:hypothetical protein [Burkholderiales bacterium]
MSALPNPPRGNATAQPTLRSAPLRRSALVARLTRPGLDPARRRIRDQLMRLSDEQLREGLGWSRADVDELRAVGRADEQVGASRPRQEDVALSLPIAA